MIFRCRVTKPSVSPWREIEAPSVEDAASEFHTRYLEFIPCLSLGMDSDSELGRRYYIRFSLVEVEGHGVMVARTYTQGIYRRGGVKDRRTTEEKLREIATALDWTHEPLALIEPGWEGEDLESPPR